MGDRYPYRRPRSPPLYNPGRASLPINVGGHHHGSHDHHLHVVPARREVLSTPRSSTNSITNGPVTTTTYKIMTEPPSRSSSIHEGSRTRGATLDANSRQYVPSALPPISRHRPVVHTGGVPESPLSPLSAYRSDGDFYTIPAVSTHHKGHHKRYSATMDNADMNRLHKERDGSRLGTGSGREGQVYADSRSRPIYSNSLVRHPDNVVDDYNENGYGYTSPRDLVQYDLNNNASRHSRQDSFENGRASRPTSITGYADVMSPRSYDTRERERGPPPTTWGLDRIQARPAWDSQSRTPSALPIEATSRTIRANEYEAEPHRRPSSRTRRPVSLYHDREARRPQEYYEPRDDDSRDRRERSHRHERYNDDGVFIRSDKPDRYDDLPDQRGYVGPDKSERPERPERPERSERPERPERPERSERSERSEKHDREKDDYSDHKSSRDKLAAGLSLAGAALGIGAVAKGNRDDDRDDRDDSRRRRDYEEEPRRRRSPREEREAIDLSGRDPKERRHRDDGSPSDREKDRHSPDVQPPFLNLSGRDPQERHQPRDAKDNDPERRRKSRGDVDSDENRPRRIPRSDVATEGTAIDSDSSPSDDALPMPRTSRLRRASGPATAFNPKDPMDLRVLKEQLGAKPAEQVPPKLSTAPNASEQPPSRPSNGFNPKDTMDLKALKEQLASKEAASRDVSKAPRESMTKESREVEDIRSDLDRGRREPLAPNDNRQLRVVSPPREKVEEKPVKGILRQPREKFPEDPSPIREGVAPMKAAKKDGVPPDARWTKIARKLVNPDALEAGKERYEAREDFVIVLRVLSREEIQAYATATQQIRAAREEAEDMKREDRRRARRERHERHKRSGRPRRHRRDHRDSDSGSDSTEEEEKPKMIEAPAPAPVPPKPKRPQFDEPVMSGGLNENTAAGNVERPVVPPPSGMGNLRENPNVPGQYMGYTRNPPVSNQGQTVPPSQAGSMIVGTGSRKDGK